MNRFRIITITTFFLVSFLPLYPALANDDVIRALKFASKDQWTQAQQHIKTVRDPDAQIAFQWFSYRRDAPNIDYSDIKLFLEKHADWPGAERLRLTAEKHLLATLSSQKIISWFDQYSPLTPRGTERYVDALFQKGQTSKAKKILNDWWVKANLERKQQRYFYQKYKQYLSRSSHIQRLNMLLYAGARHNAMGMAGVLGPDYAALAKARISLLRNEYNVDAILKAVPESLQDDPGLLYERLRWRRRHDLDQGAISLLEKAPVHNKMHSPKLWWRERHILARRLIEKKQYNKAYNLISAHRQKDGFSFAQAQWLKGWLALEFVNKSWAAFEAFEKLYYAVATPISRARAAYWTGRVSQKLGHQEIAEQWYHIAAQYPQTFYGQTALKEIGKLDTILSFEQPSISKQPKNIYEQKALVKAARWFQQAGLKNETSLILLALGNEAQTEEGFILATMFAQDLGQYNLAIKIAALAEKKEITLLEYLYPILKERVGKQPIEQALIYGIIRQESRFDQDAVSIAGARGLMQLMPATAKQVSRQAGAQHKTAWLTQKPAHNIKLGSLYLRQMLDRYNNHYAMAAAAYNAGPSRVDQWVKQFGDPSRGEIDSLNWIELIPIYETRNYVQRVLEAVYVYKKRFQGKDINTERLAHLSDFK